MLSVYSCHSWFLSLFSVLPWRENALEAPIADENAIMTTKIRFTKGVHCSTTSWTKLWIPMWENKRCHPTALLYSLRQTIVDIVSIVDNCWHEHSEINFVSDTPMFHDHPGIEPTTQLELFGLSQFPLRYVSRRPPNQKYPPGNATQLVIEGV